MSLENFLFPLPMICISCSSAWDLSGGHLPPPLPPPPPPPSPPPSYYHQILWISIMGGGVVGQHRKKIKEDCCGIFGKFHRCGGGSTVAPALPIRHPTQMADEWHSSDASTPLSSITGPFMLIPLQFSGSWAKQMINLSTDNRLFVTIPIEVELKTEQRCRIWRGSGEEAQLKRQMCVINHLINFIPIWKYHGGLPVSLFCRRLPWQLD